MIVVFGVLCLMVRGYLEGLEVEIDVVEIATTEDLSDLNIETGCWRLK